MDSQFVYGCCLHSDFYALYQCIEQDQIPDASNPDNGGRMYEGDGKEEKGDSYGSREHENSDPDSNQPQKRRRIVQPLNTLTSSSTQQPLDTLGSNWKKKSKRAGHLTKQKKSAEKAGQRNVGQEKGKRNRTSQETKTGKS